MQKLKALALYQSVEKFIVCYSPLVLSLLILLISGLMTFRLENGVVGFEKGYDELAPKHHGSVSSKTLAIITTATLENQFVGYAVRYKDEQGNVVYDYFDRYPVFFSALFHQVLELRPKLSSKIYLAKQVMNVIYVATLFVAFLLVDKLLRNKLLAVVAVLLTFANPYLLWYKDMVHFDQPALFGFLLLTYAIALYKIDSLKWPMYAATLAAIALGRGYASYAILGLWLAIEGLLILRSRELSFAQRIKNILKHPSFILVVIGIVWGGGLLAYNIVIEARQRNIPILQTSIIDSAGRRLGLNSNFNEVNEDIIDWGGYIRMEASQIIKWSSPVKWPRPNFYLSLALLAGMFLVIGIVIRRQAPERRIVLILLTFSGFIWMALMRNLAAFHDYTTMYFIGVPLAFFLSLLILLRPSRDAAYYLALMGLVVYLSALGQVRDLHEAIGGNTGEYTYDFMRIETALGSAGNNIYMASDVPNGTNAPEFYLPDQYLSPLSLADYVISDDIAYLPDNLTPDNAHMFLFKK